MGLINTKLGTPTKKIYVETANLLLNNKFNIPKGMNNILQPCNVKSKLNFDLLTYRSTTPTTLNTNIPKIALEPSNYSGSRVTLTDPSVNNISIVDGLMVKIYATINGTQTTYTTKILYGKIYFEIPDQGYISINKKDSTLYINYILKSKTTIDKIEYLSEGFTLEDLQNIKTTIKDTEVPRNPQKNPLCIQELIVDKKQRKALPKNNKYFLVKPRPNNPIVYNSYIDKYMLFIYSEVPKITMQEYLSNDTERLNKFLSGKQLLIVNEELKSKATDFIITGDISIKSYTSQYGGGVYITYSSTTTNYYIDSSGQAGSMGSTTEETIGCKIELALTKDFDTFEYIPGSKNIALLNASTGLYGVNASGLTCVNNTFIANFGYTPKFSKDGIAWTNLGNTGLDVPITKIDGTTTIYYRSINISNIKYTNGLYWQVLEFGVEYKCQQIFAYTTDLSLDWQYHFLPQTEVLTINSTTFRAPDFTDATLEYNNGVWLLYIPPTHIGNSSGSSGYTVYTSSTYKYMYYTTDITKEFTATDMGAEAKWSSIITNTDKSIMIRYPLGGASESNYGVLENDIVMNAITYSKDYGKTWTYKKSAFSNTSNNHDDMSLAYCPTTKGWYWEGGNNTQYSYISTTDPASWSPNPWQTYNMPYVIHGYYNMYSKLYCVTNEAIYEITGPDKYTEAFKYSKPSGYADPYALYLINGNYMLNTYEDGYILLKYDGTFIKIDFTMPSYSNMELVRGSYVPIFRHPYTINNGYISYNGTDEKAKEISSISIYPILHSGGIYNDL